MVEKQLMDAGKFVMSGTVPELADQVRGKVWEMTVPREQARQWQERVTVAGCRREGGQAALRIVADGRPSDRAAPCEPTLDDAYLYYFGGAEARR